MGPRICGFIAECNPLHVGHRKLITTIREKYNTVVAALSGSFVQRGSPAIADKWFRAKQLVHYGVDLVLEIPQASVLQSADYFALGAIHVLSLVPDLSAIAFGVENEAPLYDLSHPSLQRKIQDSMQSGSSYRRAVAKALGGNLEPNQILAIQYRKALESLLLPWEILIVPRETVSPNAPSATALREALAQLYSQRGSVKERESALLSSPHFLGLVDPLDYLQPRETSLEKLNRYLSVHLLLDSVDFTASPQYEEGMDLRFRRAFVATGSIEKAISAASNKRQSRARYRRLLMTTLLGIKRTDHQSPAFLRPLAFNKKGAALLKRASVPVVQKMKNVKLSDEAVRLLSIDQRAQRLYEWLNDLPNQDLLQMYLHSSLPPRG